MREFELDARLAGRGRGLDSLQARNAAQIFLLLDEDFLFDILRGRARPGGAYLHHPHVEIGDHLHGYRERGDDAEHDHDTDDDRHQSAAIDNIFEHCGGRQLLMRTC